MMVGADISLFFWGGGGICLGLLTSLVGYLLT